MPQLMKMVMITKKKKMLKAEDVLQTDASRKVSWIIIYSCSLAFLMYGQVCGFLLLLLVVLLVFRIPFHTNGTLQ